MEYSQVHNPQALNTTFQSEGLDNDYKEQRFSIKKELYRGIKDNDVHKIVSRSTDRQQQEQFKYDQYTDIHNVLTQKRRNYDEHKTITNTRKKQIQALKKQIQELLIVENSLKQTIQLSKQELSSVDQGLEQTKQEYQYTAFRKDVYENIVQRSNKIYLVEKKRLFDLELELQKVRNHHRSSVMQAANKKKLEQKCRKMLVSIEKVVGIEKKGRQHRLSSMHNVLEKKADAMRKQSQRQREISFLVQQAANQKSAQQKQWNKLFFTNRFLHCILKNKISRQLAAHEIVEKTFQRIKLHTGINQADELVQKYLTRQQTYGQLLGSISQKQPLLQRLQAENQSLKSEFKQLSQQQTFQISLSKKATPQNIQIKQKQRQLQKLSRKTISYERQKQAFYQWAIKFIKKFDVLSGQSITNKLNHYQIYPRTQMQIVHKKVQSIITQILQQSNKNPQNVHQKLLQNKLSSTLQSDMIIRNMRIKTQQNQFQHDQQGQQFNQLQFLAEHRRNIKRDEKHKRFRIKTSKAH